jgi:uncharacterized protein YndB with AHSA1/START domain
MWKKIILAIVVLVAAILLYATTRPDSFRLERSVTINASPEKVFALVNDFHNWQAWSPWEKLDPAMKRTFSGPPSGKGTVYEWAGDSKVGEGRMEIMQSLSPSPVIIKLDFLKPFEGHNTTEFTQAPEGGGTKVTWIMYGPSPYMSKLMTVFVSMDKMVGGDFETGLANLKAAAEK